MIMPWTSIPHAHEYWRNNRTLANPPPDLEEAENFILGCHPKTAQDAACILDIVCENHGDARCDGLDRAALVAIRSLLLAMD